MMRSLMHWFGQRRPTLARPSFRPHLETLEDRTLLSVSVNPSAAGAAFIRYTDGEVFYHSSSGFKKIDVNSTSISACESSTGVPAVFIVYNNGKLFEWRQDTGFHFIDLNVLAISASLTSFDTVFIIYNNGQLLEHSGSTFTSIAGGVVQCSAAPDQNGQAVFYVQNNHMLTLWVAATKGYFVIDGNVLSVNASQGFSDTAFIIYTNHALYKCDASGLPSFTFIDNNVTQVSAGLTTLGGTNLVASAYYLTGGVLVEWQQATSSYPDGIYNFVDSNVAGIDANPLSADQVFIIYATDQLFEHVGMARAPSSFTFIDGNVGP
jgi:hypothetical protein